MTQRKSSRAPARRNAEPPALPIVRAALEEMKAVDVRIIDVRGHNDVADFMVVASGTSDRHLRAIGDRVVRECKNAGQRPIGIEGADQGEWVLVDLPDVMVHLMLPRTREFYQLEQLWESNLRPSDAANAPKKSKAKGKGKPRAKSGTGNGGRASAGRAQRGTAKGKAKSAKPRAGSKAKTAARRPTRRPARST